MDIETLQEMDSSIPAEALPQVDREAEELDHAAWPATPHAEPEILDVLIEPDPEEVEINWTARWATGALASLILHFWFFSSLSSMVIPEREPIYSAPIESRLPDEVVRQEEIEAIDYELANPNDQEKEQQVALNAKSVGQILSEQPVAAVIPPAPDQPEVALATAITQAIDIPEGTELDDTLVVPGSTGEGLIQLDAALDRVTWEIAMNLKEKKVLVVWLVDASASLLEQRAIVAKRMHRIYKELDALETAGQIPNAEQPLLSAVATFGLATNYITPTPTPHVNELVSALESAPTDDSGVENVFGAVRQVIHKWMNYRIDQGRRILVVVVTDEAGDDFQHLNNSIGIVNRHGGKAYVIGPPSVFGKRQGFIPYVAPENGQTYQIPVDIGPETAVMENVQLPFWFAGPQHTNLSAGLGPYGLARLVHETGGVYFMTDMTTTSSLAPTGSYSDAPMKLFQPDYRWGTPDDLRRDIQNSRLRRSVLEAAQLSLKYKALGTPTLDLRVNPGNYLQTLNDAQKSVAESTLMIETILQAFPPSLEADYAKEESPRWRMAYNLSLGRLLAQKIRCYEYNYACAQLKQKGAQEVASKTNRWIFRPDQNINYYAGAKKQQVQAQMLLNRCVEEAPGTPWAVLAARELQYPLGIKVIEQYDPPPPPPSRDAEPGKATKPKPVLLLADERKNKATKPAPPPVPPKLPKF